MKPRVAIALGLALFAAGCQPKQANYEAYEDKAEKVAIAPPPTAGDTNTAAENGGRAGGTRHGAASAGRRRAPGLLVPVRYRGAARPYCGPAFICTSGPASRPGRASARCSARPLARSAVTKRAGSCRSGRSRAGSDRFRASIEADTRAAGGRLVGSNVQTEDLTRSIVDTDAALRTKRELRDRLEALLQRPSNGVKDLLATEQELARVQGEIDTAQSELAVMRARVQMSGLDIDYRSTSSLAPDRRLRTRGRGHARVRQEPDDLAGRPVDLRRLRRPVPARVGGLRLGLAAQPAAGPTRRPSASDTADN